ncbi:MAG: serine acetyltransferase [Oscillospiraceae bacterium]|nr:serine acetyltransferase [Oscillospiraceae bacterium]
MLQLINRILKYIIYLPLWFSFLLIGRKNKTIIEDFIAAKNRCRFHRSENMFFSFMNYVCFLPEYRQLYLYRLGSLGLLLRTIYKNRLNLFFHCSDIKGGIFIQHGYSTIINAKSIGRNCQIWHNVTIGVKQSGGGIPIIKNNVKICAGACVLGDIIIGNNVTIGANAVCITNVPDNSIAVGVPAKVLTK